MWIFIRQIPELTSRKELVQFVQRGLFPGPRLLHLFSKRRIRRCELMTITDRDTGLVEHHGLVEIEPTGTINRLVQRLDGAILRGKGVGVRRYYHRSPHRDRRQIPDTSHSTPAEERRLNDRRRLHLHVAMEQAPQVEGIPAFHRMHN